MCIYYTLTTMTILTAGSGCAKLIFLPMRFCARQRTLPSRFCAPFLFTFHYYLRMLWCTYAHKTIWLYYSINFLPPQTYLLILQTPNSIITNYWYKTYELLIQNLRTIDTKLTNYWYKTYELLILNLQTTNPFCYKLQILKLQTTNPFWYKLQILILQTTNPFC